MEGTGNIKILFVAGFGPIVDKGKASQKLYLETFGLPLKRQEGDYLYMEEMEGVKHFALWPLPLVAQACFGKDSWPGDVPVPQAWIDFEVENLAKATAELESRGYRMLVASKKEPWGQTATRFISPEGLLAALTITPWLRENKQR